MEPVPFFPWGFLNKPSISSHQEHTFVQALNHVCNIPLNQLPMLCLKGEPILVTILEDKYRGSLEGNTSLFHKVANYHKTMERMSILKDGNLFEENMESGVEVETAGLLLVEEEEDGFVFKKHIIRLGREVEGLETLAQRIIRAQRDTVAPQTTFV
ncbi:hypothetical protein JHK87_006594 [Glycine soja]|nr:hypothetical protein JHK87_006594 [Glycine soja]